MKKITCLSDAEEIHDQASWMRFKSRQDFVELFRGEASTSYLLKPGLLRIHYTINEYLQKEEGLYNDMMEARLTGQIILQNSIHGAAHPTSQIWFNLFQAQHLGLKTRFLDWTANWRAALLFAVENETRHDEDGQFWVFMCPNESFISDGLDREIIERTPFEVNRLLLINHPFFYEPAEAESLGERRRMRLHGRFTVQPMSQAIIPLDAQPENSRFFNKILIDKDCKSKIKSELAAIGITMDWARCRHDKNLNDAIASINNRYGV